MEDDFTSQRRKYASEGWNAAGANMLSLTHILAIKKNHYILQRRSIGYYVIVASLLVSITYILLENKLGIDPLMQAIFFGALLIGQISSNVTSWFVMLVMLDKKQEQQLVNHLVDLVLKDDVDPEDEKQVYKYLEKICDQEPKCQQIFGYLRSLSV